MKSVNLEMPDQLAHALVRVPTKQVKSFVSIR